MSWDLTVYDPTDKDGYRELFWVNYTSNTNEIIRRAGVYPEWPWEVNEQPASAVAIGLRSTADAIEARRDEFKVLEPANGWGSIAILVPVLRRAADDLGRLGDLPVSMCA